MSPPSRRDALALSGGVALAAVSGCLGTLFDDTTDATVGKWVSTDDGREMRVDEPAVHRSVVTAESVSHHVYEVVATPTEGQYLVVTVETRGVDVEPLDLPLSIAVDGDRGREQSVIRVGRDEVVGRDRLAFNLPAVEASEVAVVWEREDGSPVRWTLGGRVRDQLAAVPAFAVESMSVPDEVTRGDDIPASFTVRNVGDRDGRFLTTFGVKMGSLGVPEVSTQVPAGETVTESERLRPPRYGNADSLRVVMDWGRGQRDATVEVVDRSTTTPTGSDDGA